MRWPLLFAIIALVVGIFAFGGLTEGTARLVARVLFVLALLVFIFSVLARLIRRSTGGAS